MSDIQDLAWVDDVSYTVAFEVDQIANHLPKANRRNRIGLRSIL